jgi:translation initiation factor IF-2
VKRKGLKNNMSDDKKLTLPSKPLGVGKGSDSGQVRQNFSHGRGKSVVVEHKKKRFLNKGAAPAVAKASVPGKPAMKVPHAYVPKRPAGEGSNTLSTAEQQTRLRALEGAKKRAEDDAKVHAEQAALRAIEDAERQKRQAEEKQDEEVVARHAAEDAAKKKADDDARKKAESDAEKKLSDDVAAREKAEEEARKKAELEARAVQLRKASEARTAAKPETTSDARKGKPKRKDNKRGDNRDQRNNRGKNDGGRKTGRLTISAATGGGDRQRSLAAYKRAQAKKRAAEMGHAGPQKPQSREITIPEAISVQDLAQRIAEKGIAVIKTLMGLGIVATINETLDQDTAQLVVEEFGHTVKRVSEADVEIGLFGEEDKAEDLKSRAPIVTVMGHVDHGKTSLLDALRKSNVVSGEAGGITQHIGAYQVNDHKGDKITFLDTPGHAAFTQMRARGASVTDIVILVVAADDGVMPQTIEAINHSKAAGVPMIIAINKMDREGADPDRVRNELLQHEVVTETFSGDVQEVEVSAITGAGLDKLREAIALQAEILELKANANRSAEGVVVEAKLDKGRGPVATVLVRRGTLNIGDIFVAGAEWGKVRAIINDQGSQIKTAGPSQPVEVLGANSAPGAGDDFAVVDSEARAREITGYRQEIIRKKRQAALAAPKTLESIFEKLKESGEQINFDVVVKADVQGSVEAITQALEKAGNDLIKCRVIHGAVGGITETDVGLAHASGAMMIGFNVRPSRQAREVAEADGVAIKYYSIIYNLIDDVKAALIGELGPEFKENIIGRANIKDAFQAGKAGKAAGCMVIEGSIRNDLKARILRDDVIIYEGQIENLRRFKDDVKKVDSGQECGLTFQNYHDFKSGDVLEVYELEQIERTL